MSNEPTPLEPPDEEGVSLRALSEAFAQAIGAQPPPDQEPPAATGTAVVAKEAEASAALPKSETTEQASEDACPLEPQSILEAMLFVGHPEGLPLTPARAAELMRGVMAAEIPAMVTKLNRRYAAHGCPYEIVGAGPGYRLRLRPAFREVADRFRGKVREARLSQAAVDVLAIVAYRQPITAEEVGRQRGRPSHPILTQLVRRRLLRLERGQRRGDAAHYFTTGRFLDLFGLASIGDLPQAEDFEAAD